MACFLKPPTYGTARRERYLVYELLPGGDVHSRLNKDLRRRRSSGRLLMVYGWFMDDVEGVGSLHTGRLAEG